MINFPGIFEVHFPVEPDALILADGKPKHSLKTHWYLNLQSGRVEYQHGVGTK